MIIRNYASKYNKNTSFHFASPWRYRGARIWYPPWLLFLKKRASIDWWELERYKEKGNILVFNVDVDTGNFQLQEHRISCICLLIKERKEKINK